MSATKLAVLGALFGAALLAALWSQRDDGASRAERSAFGPDAGHRSVAAGELPLTADTALEQAATSAPLTADPTGLRPTEGELRTKAAEESYARIGSVFVDHLVEQGLARADGEAIVRQFLDENVHCLFDALRVEANAQSVSYDAVLDATEANLYGTDGPLLGAVIDMRAVENRVAPCALTAAQQAGIEPSALSETTRAAIVRRAR
jgi:hypothetical protein